MTISHQPPQKPSASDSPKSFAIPPRPSAHAAAGATFPTRKKADESEQGRSFPARAFTTRAQQSALEEQPHPQEPFTFSEQPFAASTTHAHQRNEQPPSVPPAPSRPARGKRGPLYLTLAVLAVLVVLGGLLGQRLLNGGSGAGSSANDPLTFSGSGPYARLPLSAEQINAIQHLAGHMKYKALASLYVSHMSLDDEIGQLIMVEYNQPTYSSDLDYMLHTLHVGGVIMYEFQMTSFNQTKNDIARMQQRANIPLIITPDEEGGPYGRS